MLPTGAHAAFGDITLEGQLTLTGISVITDVWGYYDAVSGKHYAIVGDWSTGIFIIDVTTPSLPTLVKRVTGLPGFDVKVWDHYVYTCDGNGAGTDSRIVDISNVNNPVLLAGAFDSCHNIAISDEGVMYLEYLGLTAFNLEPEPTTPAFLWYNSSNGHDATPDGNRLYDFSGWDATMTIWDVSDPDTALVLGTITDPAINYYHSGDDTKNSDYLYICDELSADPEPDIVVWNISNLGSPFRVTSLRDATATVHNLYIVGDLGFVSHYTAGFKTLDVSNPASPVVADTYDTSGFSGEGYDGAFGVYPFASTGMVYVSDHPNGFYIFSVEGYNGPPTSVGNSPAAEAAWLGQNFPNPFNPSTSIRFTLPSPADTRLEVFDVRGALVKTLVDGTMPAGPQQVEWNGTNGNGRAVASGVYYYRLRSAGSDVTRKMVLLK
jgi:hypothetical protein